MSAPSDGSMDPADTETNCHGSRSRNQDRGAAHPNHINASVADTAGASEEDSLDPVALMYSEAIRNARAGDADGQPARTANSIQIQADLSELSESRQSSGRHSASSTFDVRLSVWIGPPIAVLAALRLCVLLLAVVSCFRVRLGGPAILFLASEMLMVAI